MPHVSIIIPTYGRSYELRECLESLWAQTEQDFEIIQVKEKGELAALRNQGASRAQGEILIFIDDDVVCSPRWLESILQTFEDKSIAGVSGPAFINKTFKAQRDIFREPYGTFYKLSFCGRQSSLPGHITKAGAWTSGAAERGCKYDGPVEFLEACNMSYRRSAFMEANGFDTAYGGIGDWSEPDLSFRIRQAGHRLWFCRDAKLEHRCSRTGAYEKRRGDSRNRMANYERFAARWVRPCWQHTFYKCFLRTYYWLKERGVI